MIKCVSLHVENWYYFPQYAGCLTSPTHSQIKTWKGSQNSLRAACSAVPHIRPHIKYVLSRKYFYILLRKFRGIVWSQCHVDGSRGQKSVDLIAFHGKYIVLRVLTNEKSRKLFHTRAISFCVCLFWSLTSNAGKKNKMKNNKIIIKNRTMNVKCVWFKWKKKLWRRPFLVNIYFHSVLIVQ